MKWEMKYTHVIERKITCIVEADSEEEAIQKGYDGDYLESDEDDCPEDGIEIKDKRATLYEGIADDLKEI